MVDTISKSIKPGIAQQQSTLDASIASTTLLKATQTSQTAVTTPIDKDLIRDLKGYLQIAQKQKALSPSETRTIKEQLDHAEQSGTLKFGISNETLRNYKTILNQAIKQSVATRRSATKPYEKHEAKHYRHGVHRTVYPPNHPLSQVRREMFAMILNNRQLAGIDQNKQLMDQKNKGGFGQDFSAEKTVDEVLAERLRSALDLQKATELQDRSAEEASTDFFKIDVDTGFANELRNQSQFGFLDGADGLDVLLDGVVDMMPYIVARRASATGRDSNDVAAEVMQFQEFVQRRKKTKKNGLVDEEDCETLLLVQYLPMLYDAVNYIMEKNLSPEAVSKMESLKGELAALIQAASDPESAIHELFKGIKDSLQDREMVEWTG